MAIGFDELSRAFGVVDNSRLPALFTIKAFFSDPIECITNLCSLRFERHTYQELLLICEITLVASRKRVLKPPTVDNAPQGFSPYSHSVKKISLFGSGVMNSFSNVLCNPSLSENGATKLSKLAFEL